MSYICFDCHLPTDVRILHGSIVPPSHLVHMRLAFKASIRFSDSNFLYSSASSVGVEGVETSGAMGSTGQLEMLSVLSSAGRWEQRKTSSFFASSVNQVQIGG